MSLRSHISWIAIALVLTLLLSACAVPQSGPQEVGLEPPAAEPGAWVETDALLRINSEVLASHFRSGLNQLGSLDGIEFRGAEFSFDGASIGLAIPALLTEPDGSSREVALAGEIILSFSGAGLRWFPYIDHVAGETAGSEDEVQNVLERVNSALVRQIVIPGGNALAAALAPAREITLGARLPALSGEASSAQYTLPGAFTVAASRVQANAEYTAMALDLEYVPGISHCTGDISISRSAFARRIVNREPREIEARLDPASPELHYFTEVSDARRSLTLVHYWFADGRPIGVTELPVEPSARWRTWSSLPVKPGVTRHIEVFAADRDSGCIADAAHIELAPAAWEDTAGAFEAIAWPFPATAEVPRIAVAELSPRVLADALNQAAARGRFAVRLEASEAREHPLVGYLDSPAGSEFNCEWRDCSARTECRVDFARCQRKQDTRECTTCLFRNPLNDRCMSERVDPECESRKAGLNASFASAFEACMAREESAQRACEEQGREALDDCELKARQYGFACAANRQALAGRGDPIATISGRARAVGGVAMVFSGLQATDDFQRFKGRLSIEPELALSGELELSAAPSLGALGACIDNWDASFEVIADRSQPARRLAGAVKLSGSDITVSWPGVTVPLNLEQGPLEAILQAHPGWLETCPLGLTPPQLGARAGGENGFVLRGILPLDVEPGETRIRMAPITANLQGKNYSASPAFQADGYVRFEFAESGDDPE